jgi:hypothetical protein
MGIILYYYFLKTKVGHNLCYPKFMWEGNEC